MDQTVPPQRAGNIVEGSILSKWTNVMKGWQFRWFVLDENTGLLSYYTSKEKMRRGVRRGCIRLQGAVLGIDDEEDANFTITVDAKVFHLQAKDAEEREIWVRALEEAILKHARVRPGSYLPHHLTNTVSGTEEPLIRFEQRLAQADVYLQMLIQQVAAIEGKSELTHVVTKANEFLEAVKHSIVLLQIAKNTAFPIAGLSTPVVLHYSDPEIQTGIEFGSECREIAGSSLPKSVSSPIARVLTSGSSIVGQSPISPNEKSPVFISYSSSDDEQDFYDASEDLEGDTPDANALSGIVVGGDLNILQPRKIDEEEEINHKVMGTVGGKEKGGSRDSSNELITTAETTTESQQPMLPRIDYDALYDEDLPEDDLGSVESHGSVLSHLLSQVKIGMDLTKVVLPTFILERRSLLEMYADFFAHPDMFVAIADVHTPRDRIVAILRWYLGAFHAGRRSEVAKKPYNPILGEIFQCYWNLPSNRGARGGSSTSSTSSSKDLCSNNSDGRSEKSVNNSGQLFQWVDDPDALIFFGEQVSHHPPISAFYAEHVKKQISLNAHIWTKSKFLGLSIGVHNVGHALLTLHHPSREDYVLGFPNGYARSIFTVPWIELGGPVTISSTQTGYNARVEFHTKPFFGGDKNKVTAQVFSPDDKKKPFLTVEGEWNGVMTGKWSDGRTEKFVDVRKLEIVKKRTRLIAQQDPHESRRMWKEVTAGLKIKHKICSNDFIKQSSSGGSKALQSLCVHRATVEPWENQPFFCFLGMSSPLLPRFRDIDKATDAKYNLEEKQRSEARERREKCESWKPRMFIPAGDTWIFSEPLEQRVKARQKLKASISSSSSTSNSPVVSHPQSS